MYIITGCQWGKMIYRCLRLLSYFNKPGAIRHHLWGDSFIPRRGDISNNLVNFSLCLRGEYKKTPALSRGRGMRCGFYRER